MVKSFPRLAASKERATRSVIESRLLGGPTTNTLLLIPNNDSRQPSSRMASFLSTAASYLGRSTLQSEYLIDSSATPVYCGPWKIQRAVKKSGTSSPAPGASSSNAAGASSSSASVGAEGVVASIWEAKIEAKGGARQVIVDTLKKEAASLTRLRHPCILSVIAPLEETRSSLVFATEPVVASLHQAILASESAGRASSEIALDEVESRKGLLQIARGLEFLHGAGLVHGNLTSDTGIIINAKGDWKICGFGFLSPLKGPDGTPTPFRHPDYDPSLPPSLSVNFDFLAPEYALDEKREPSNDMYSLGCVIYAVHARGDPPFRNRNSLTNLRSNADRLSTLPGSSEWTRLGRDVNELLSSLLTRYPGSRLTATSFQQATYFNNILVSTLKFLERESFSGRTKEERVQFLKGLLGVLPQFSDRLLRRKVLPALLELMTDRSLLPFILPNVFHIAATLSSIEFTNTVLPRLQPLFTLQDPPQNQLMLLQQLDLFVSKTSPTVFREGVTPLLYSALESEQPSVQERALQQVPRLCEVLEYSHVKEVLFPKIATVFSKTKILSIKVNTLISMHQMVPILDKYTLTEKLVPLLSRIKTREPSVMLSTLAVHESLATKVSLETLAVHIIPQLWTMSMGPLLSADQFEKFMIAVKTMGDRVALEHGKELKEVRRMQEAADSSQMNGGDGGSGSLENGVNASGDVDFATLVGSGKDSSMGVPRDVTGQAGSTSTSKDIFDPFAFDEPSTSVTPLGSGTPTVLTPSHTESSAMIPTASRPAARPLGSLAMQSSSRTNSFGGGSSMGGSSSTLPTLAAPPKSNSFSSPPLAPSRLNNGASSSSSSLANSFAAMSSPSLSSTGLAGPPGWSGSTLMPSNTNKTSTPNSKTTGAGGGPNYNLSLSPASNFGASSTSSTSLTSTSTEFPPLQATTSSLGSFATSITPALSQQQAVPQATATGPPGWNSNSVLQPLRPKGAGGAIQQAQAKQDWGDFDPLG